MKRIKIFLIMVIVFYSTATFAQVNPFAKYGYDVKVLTMTNGRFNEFFDMDTVVQIGDLLFNTNSMKIIGFAEKDSITPMPDASVISRWVSPDPLAEKYWSITPYSYVVGNPIVYIDPDGRFVWKPEFNDAGEIILVKERGDNAETLHNQLKTSGYNTTYEQAVNLVNNADENGDINLSQNTSIVEGTDFETTVNLVTEQKQNNAGVNCVDIALVTLEEYKNEGILSKGYDKPDEENRELTWAERANNGLINDFTNENQSLQGGRTVFISRNSDGKVTHGSRFFMKGKQGQNWSVHKYGWGGHININKANRWERITNKNKIKTTRLKVDEPYNPK